MKKLILLILASIYISITSFSQPCLPYGITFTTQTQIDSFQINYPGCTMIQGSVNITGNDITNLNGLDVLTSMGTELNIYGTSRLKNLVGLDSLSTDSDFSLYFNNNDSLTSLEGLGPITSVHDLQIYNNPVLQSLNGLNSIHYVLYSLIIESNSSLVDLSGLDDLFYIGVYGVGLHIINNPNLQNLTGLENLLSIDNNFRIEQNSSLENLTGLETLASIDADFYVGNNSNLTDLTGIENLSSVGSSFEIKYNEKLKNLSGLNSLTSVGTLLNIQNNDSLMNILALENLNSLVALQIYDNNIIHSLAGIEGINPNYINYINIKYNDSLSECDVLSLCSYLLSGGGASINNNNTGCNSPEEVKEACLTGISELYNYDETFKLYPNPTNKLLNIKAVNVSSSYCIEIRNLFGQIVKEENRIQLLHHTLKVNDLKSGVYFYTIWGNGEIVQQGKLIIN